VLDTQAPSLYVLVSYVPKRAQERGAVGEFLSEHWGDLVTVVGFALTIFLLWRSKSAAEAARGAAQTATDQLRRNLTLTDVTTATGMIDQVMGLQRQGLWDVVLDKLAALKRLLIRIREQNPGFTEEQLKVMQKVVNQVSQLRGKVEKLLADTEQEADVVKWNRILDAQLDRLEAIAVAVRLSRGDRP